jgi:hypothetical protein
LTRLGAAQVFAARSSLSSTSSSAITQHCGQDRLSFGGGSRLPSHLRPLDDVTLRKAS